MSSELQRLAEESVRNEQRLKAWELRKKNQTIDKLCALLGIDRGIYDE